MNKYLVASLEAIERQDKNKLFYPLSSYMTRLMGCSDDNDRSKIILEMEKLIRSKTGINVEILHTEGDMTIRFDRQVITLNFPYAYRSEKMIINLLVGNKVEMWNTKDIKGDVDLKNGVVRGDFSKVPCRIYFPIKDYDHTTTLTAEERAAMVLHEIGHVVSLYEHIAHQAILSVNQAAVVAAWLGKDTMQKVKVIQNIQNDMGIKFDDPFKLSEDDDPARVCAVVAAASITKHRNELGLVHYDATAFETMADTFAVQHGAGRHIVTALDKQHRADPSPFKVQGYRPVHLRAFSALAFFAGTVGTAVAAPALGAGLAGLVIANVLATTSIMTHMVLANPGPKNYEKPLERYLTVKRNMIQTLKSGQLDKLYVQQTLEDLEAIEKVINSVNSDVGILGIAHWIAGIVNGSSKEIRIRKQYEELANNKLFVSTTKLSQLVNK